ncbi:MAG: hypothetical protein U0168_14860 [Nannocystaceae bacterium]
MASPRAGVVGSVGVGPIGLGALGLADGSCGVLAGTEGVVGLGLAGVGDGVGVTAGCGGESTATAASLGAAAAAGVALAVDAFQPWSAKPIAPTSSSPLAASNAMGTPRPRPVALAPLGGRDCGPDLARAGSNAGPSGLPGSEVSSSGAASSCAST